jgi:hypothetical protein
MIHIGGEEQDHTLMPAERATGSPRWRERGATATSVW